MIPSEQYSQRMKEIETLYKEGKINQGMKATAFILASLEEFPMTYDKFMEQWR